MPGSDRVVRTSSITTLLIAVALLFSGPLQAQGTLEQIKVHGRSLEGNLEGDSPDRDVFVYLPASYASEPTRHYPVVYYLHGYSVGAQAYIGLLGWPQSADAIFANGTPEMILVMPDALTVYGGSMYSNSPTTGNWEGYVSRDLVAYIDSHYRTLPERGSRGLAGHSMGGYGTLRIGMKHPEVFSALYAMSACCLMNNAPGGGATAGRGRAQGDGNAARGDTAARGDAPAARGRGRGGFGNAPFAQAAAWAPNPMNPPQYFDLPSGDDPSQAVIAAKWHANSPLVMVDQYVPNLQQYRAIALDVGDQDGLSGVNVQLDEALTRLGIEHTFELYEGNHGNRVSAQVDNKVLPFFAQYLDFD